MSNICAGCGQAAINLTRAGRPICPDCLEAGYGDDDAVPVVATSPRPIDRDEFAKCLGNVFTFMDKASGEELHFADCDLEAVDIVVELATILDMNLIDCADIPASITEAVLAALSPTPAADEVEAVARAIQDAHAPGHPINHVSIYQARAAIAALQARSAEPAASAWIVGNGNRTRWRRWIDGTPTWIASRDHATRYTRREDAEAVHAEDEDAWRVEPYPAEPAGEEPVLWVAPGQLEQHTDPTKALYYPEEAGNYLPARKTRAGQFIMPLYTRPATPTNPERRFTLGQRVTKTKGSSWTGHVVGFYSTGLTAIGYAVESETETGSVQIYPEAALSVAPLKEGE